MNSYSPMAYHGSLRRFPAFQEHPAFRMTVSPTAYFGIFCVADPKIAAHFTLRPHVISEGYDSPQGSRVLRTDPWLIDSDPFAAGASVAEVEVKLRRPRHFTAVDWASLVESLSNKSEVAQSMLGVWKYQGYDGLRIEAWDQCSITKQGHLPSVETDATTWVAFDSSTLVIRRWFDAVNAWQ